MSTKKARRRQRKQALQPIGRAVNAENWCGRWPACCIRADLWYRAQLRELGLWPPPPERLVFEGRKEL